MCPIRVESRSIRDRIAAKNDYQSGHRCALSVASTALQHKERERKEDEEDEEADEEEGRHTSRRTTHSQNQMKVGYDPV